MIRPPALLLSALALGVPAGLLAGEPHVDPKRIVNESNSFLKEREPEMTEEEYALYQKVVTMLAANPDFAVKLLEAMSAGKDAPSPAFLFILGNAYYAAGQNGKAEANYRAAVTGYPNFLRAWVNLGILYYSTGRFGEAVPCFSKAVVLGDRDSTTFGLLGYCLQREGDLVSAEMAYMQALGGEPANVDWKEGLLEICIDGKQFTRAESLVKNLIKERPTDTRYWLADANILLAEGRKVDETVVLETAVGAGLGDATELALLGDLYAEQDLVPEAADTYQRLLALAPDAGGPKLLRYARVLTAAGRLPEAEGVLGRLDRAEKGVDPVALRQAKADLYAAERRWPDARQQVEDILKEDPLNGQALLSLGRAYAAEDNLPRATLAFESAAAIKSSTYEASLELANIELKNRHYAKSAEYLQKALNIERTDAVEDDLARVKALVPKES